MSRRLSIGSAALVISALLAGSGAAATLETLSLERLTVESTAILRARVSEPRFEMRGPVIYTIYRVSPTEMLKGASLGAVTVAVPGGRIGDAQQSFAGAPRLETSREYLLFLWTGPSGLTQLTGLSQGLFELQSDPTGELYAVRHDDPELRPAAPGPPAGQAASAPAAARQSYTDLRERIAAILAEAKAAQDAAP